MTLGNVRDALLWNAVGTVIQYLQISSTDL